MDSSIEEKLLQHLNLTYGHTDNLSFIGGFQNKVYSFTRDNREYILRLTAPSHRSKALLLGEIDWINYLHNHGFSVSSPIPSKNENYVEEFEIDGTISYSVIFEKAMGRSVTQEEWNDTFFTNWGQMIGKMHALTKNYKVSDPIVKRPEQEEKDKAFFSTVTKVFHSADINIQIYNKVLNQRNSFPKTNDTYGLIHNDAHQGNFFIHNNDITLFDFDESSYNWLANDIAIPLFYAVKVGTPANEDREMFAKRFLSNFLKGYSKEYQVHDDMLVQIPVFLKLREIDLYVLLCSKLQLNNLTAKRKEELQMLKHRISNHVPFLNVNLQKI
jgi:Ser/Thr protein kinase RdoA (MazF antagonist)